MYYYDSYIVDNHFKCCWFFSYPVFSKFCTTVTISSTL